MLSSLIRKRDKIVASMICASAMANVAPMQMRGPAPKGVNAPSLFHDAGMFAKRSGMKAGG